MTRVTRGYEEPPRFQPLPLERARWPPELDEAHETGDTPVAVWQLWCWMRDCRGKLGQVQVERIGDSKYELVNYLAPRGYVTDHAGADWLISIGARMERKRQRGQRPTGSQAHGHPGADWQRDVPLRPWEMPGPTLGLEPGQIFHIQCPDCRIVRRSRLTLEDVRDARRRLD